jgi:hypothetical protein
VKIPSGGLEQPEQIDRLIPEAGGIAGHAVHP